MSKGTIYGVGIGPGDPDLMSVKADRLVRNARHVAFFRKKGRTGQARQIVEMGLCLGIGGTLTFKKNDAAREVVRSVGAEALLLETDAPYLAPVPRRGDLRPTSRRGGRVVGQGLA